MHTNACSRQQALDVPISHFNFARKTCLASLILSLLAIVIATPSSARAESARALEAASGLLPRNVKPLAYRLNLKPNFERIATADDKEDIDFWGDANIDVLVRKPTDVIVLNAVDIVFHSVTLDGVTATQIIIDRNRQTVMVRFANKLPAGRHNLTISYVGRITARPYGLYYSNYKTVSDTARMLMTQLEATGARLMFPCWDEPAAKATLALSVEVPVEFRAISNMPAIREELLGSGRKRVVFAPTPKMPTYLVVLVAGEIDRIRETVSGTRVGIVTVKGKEVQGVYGFDVIRKVLPYLENYFGVKYPLPKIDLIAAPNFPLLAMEGWGGIVFSEKSLFYNPTESDLATQIHTFEVIAHEMTHQWFGNLVTMRWWNDLWLNEGFANWMQKKVTDRFNQEWKIWSNLRKDKEKAMIADELRSARPIRRPIADTSDIASAFDVVTYEKGAAIFRMLEAWLGDTKFRAGIRAYIKAHAYSNATAFDLWAALTSASHKPVSSVMRTFLEVPGVPLIHVSTTCVNDRTIATLRQDEAGIRNDLTSPRKWRVPVAIARIGERKRVFILGAKPRRLRFADCRKPVIANFGDVGYYRVQYDGVAQAAVRRTLNTLAPEDCVGVLADTWAMVLAGRVDVKDYLDLVNVLATGVHPSVWSWVIDTLWYIDDLERGSADRDAFRTFAQNLIRPVFNKLGWEPKAKGAEAPPNKLLRPLLIRALGRFGDQQIIEAAHRRFALFQQNSDMLDQELRDAVITVVGHSGNRRIFDQLRKLARSATADDEKSKYYYALAGANDPELIEQIVAIALTDELASGEVDHFLVHAASASDDPDRMWALVLDHRERILRKLNPAQRQKLLPRVARASFSPSIASELRSMTTGSEASEGARYEGEKAAEEIELKAEQRGRLLPSIGIWLRTTHHSTAQAPKQE
jgi:aminopeptidase N